MSTADIPYTLETVTGKFVNLLEPDPKDICITDISWSLSRLARYNGHTIQIIPYSVGQHSIFVANEILKTTNDRVLALKGLLHDAGEAYTGDISGPLKKIPELRPIIKKIEHNIDAAIFDALGIGIPTEEEERIIKGADMIAQRIESYNFMVSRGVNWTNMPEVSIEKLQEFEMPIVSNVVHKQFLELYYTLNTDDGQEYL